MLKGKQTNRIQHASVCLVGEAFNKFFTPKVFWHDSTVCVKKKKEKKITSDGWHTVYDPFGNVYYAAYDSAHCRWLQASVMPRESVKRSQAKQVAWLEGGHAVTRKHVSKMHKASGTSRVFETHWLSLHKRTKMYAAFPSAVRSEWHSVSACETGAKDVWWGICLMWL